ncbi:MAG: PqiC family protein [Burkholderiales bacterium]|nr:PqiC family protein [Burkholderiales bacterium]
MKTTTLLAPMAIAAALSTTLVGCASAPPVRYYSLSTALPAKAVASTNTLLVELPPLALPERLVRPQMVVRTASGQLEILDQHRWSAPFNTELRDALAAGITQPLGAIDVSNGGRLAGQPVYRIAVQLRQWEAVENSRIEASFSWTIRRSDDARNLACQWSQSEPVGLGTQALAEGAQRLTARAAQSMAAALAALDADAGARCPA